MTYPHERDDCVACWKRDADMIVTLNAGDNAERRWCQRCAGPLLARLVLQGYTAVVSRFEAPSPPGRESVRAELRRRRDAGLTPSTWTVELAMEILRQARPSASTFIRALVEEGGTADTETLKRRTGTNALHHMTQTLNTAARALWVGPLPHEGPRLFVAQPLRDPDKPRALNSKVLAYTLTPEQVTVFAEALQRLGR